ncbi:ABC transporter ATP-binding protein [Lactobacillaceae bacterium L1_55_11]|nr:ABC transporter ATP-binding protein [Lactobacillaceae bacterium L1_55_11]
MINLSHINKYYRQGKQRFHALKDININVDEGEFVAIMGESGSGKSTLINIIGFLDEKFEGLYEFNGENVGKLSRSTFSKIRNQNVGFVFQNFKLINNQTVKDNVALPLLYAGKTMKEAEPAIEKVLAEVGLADFKDQFPKNLSGGQQQRVSIARALISRPKFLIADEPTGALDSHTSAEIIDLFKELNAAGMTVIMVTHDPKVGQATNRIIRILDGKKVSDEEVAHAL